MTYEEVYWKLNDHLVALEKANQTPSDELIELLEWLEIAMDCISPMMFPTKDALRDWKQKALTLLKGK